jgi:hypothetical protein
MLFCIFIRHKTLSIKMGNHLEMQLVNQVDIISIPSLGNRLA